MNGEDSPPGEGRSRRTAGWARGIRLDGERRWGDGFIGAEFEIGFRAHGEGEFAARSDIAVMEPGARLPLAVEGEGLDVGMLRVLAPDFDSELLTLAEVDDGVVEEGRAEDVVSADGVYGIEAKGAQHEPGGHLADVFVALHAVGSGGVHQIGRAHV